MGAPAEGIPRQHHRMPARRDGAGRVVARWNHHPRSAGMLRQARQDAGGPSFHPVGHPGRVDCLSVARVGRVAVDAYHGKSGRRGCHHRREEGADVQEARRRRHDRKRGGDQGGEQRPLRACPLLPGEGGRRVVLRGQHVPESRLRGQAQLPGRRVEALRGTCPFPLVPRGPSPVADDPPPRLLPTRPQRRRLEAAHDASRRERVRARPSVSARHLRDEHSHQLRSVCRGADDASLDLDSLLHVSLPLRLQPPQGKA